MEVKKLCWELVFDWMIRRNEQQTSGFLNAATFLVRGACFVFHVSQNFDSTRVLDLFVLYFSISGKMKKIILMKP